MNRENSENGFNSSIDFDSAIVEILYKLMGDKLTDFLKYCITTHNAQPIKTVLEILDSNKF